MTIQLPKWKCNKEVWALKIARIDGCKLSFTEAGYGPLSIDIKIFARYKPVPGDYYVQYEDGYKSFSPAKAFEEGYTRI